MLDPFEVMDRFGTDALRYYCFREVSFGQDGGVSTKTFGERYETELANELGNLASRTLNMLGRYRDGVVPDGRGRARSWRRTSTASPRRSRALLDQAEITQALERIWQRVRRLNRYVEENAPWQLAKDESKADELNTVLRTLAEGLRVLTVLLTPYIPESAEKLLDALGAPETDIAARGYGAHPGGQPVAEARAPLPEAGVIDSHTHLDRGPAPEAELVAQAREAGLTRILTIGMDAPSCAAALARGGDLPGGLRRDRPPPERGDRLRRRRSPSELREFAQHPHCRAIGETGLDDFRDYAPRADQERAFARPDRARARDSASR